MTVTETASTGTASTTGPEVKAIQPVAEAPRREGRTTRFIPVSEIDPDPDQPRAGELDQTFIAELAESIRRHGRLTHPITVTPPPAHLETDKPWVILTGEQRWRAHLHLGWPIVECLLDDRAYTPAERLDKQLDENDGRTGLTLLQRITARYRQFEVSGLSRRDFSQQFGMSQAALSKLAKAHHALFPRDGDRAEVQELKEALRNAAATRKIDDLEVLAGITQLEPDVAKSLLRSCDTVSRRRLIAAQRNARKQGDAHAPGSEPGNVVRLELTHEQLVLLCLRLGLRKPESPDEGVETLLCALAPSDPESSSNDDGPFP